MNRFLLKLDTLTDNKIRIYSIGLLPTLSISFREVIKSTYINFQIFSFGSFDFWNGVNPYLHYLHWNHLSLLGKPLDSYLYSP